MKTGIAFVYSALLSIASATVAPPSSNDLVRAATTLPRSSFTGGTFEERAYVLNGAIEASAGLQAVPCEEYSLADVFTVWEMLKASANPELGDIYDGAGDRRRLSRLSDLFVPEDGDLAEVMRDTMCIDSAMMYAHHLGEADKEEFHILSSIPMMPIAKQVQTGSTDEHNRAHKRYLEACTCDLCHADVPVANPDAPRWADSFFQVSSYQATAASGVVTNIASMRWYDWNQRAYIDEQTSNGVTNVVMRVGGVLYMFTPSTQECRVRTTPMDPVAPTWMQGSEAFYVGDETFDDVPCEVWDVDDTTGQQHRMWWAKSDGRPVRLYTTGGPQGIRDDRVAMYIPDVTIDPSRFEIPSYCPGSNPRTPDGDDDDVLTTIEVAGIAVGCVAGVALLAGAFVFSKRQSSGSDANDMSAALMSSGKEDDTSVEVLTGHE